MNEKPEMPPVPPEPVIPESHHSLEPREPTHTTTTAPILLETIPKKTGFEQTYDSAPDGWMPNKRVANSFGTTERVVKKIAEKHRETNSEWFRKYKTSGGRVFEHYAPPLVDLIREEISRIEHAPEGWATPTSFMGVLGANYETIKKAADKYRTAHPEWFKEYKALGRACEHYSPELNQSLIKDFSDLKAPAMGWATNKAVSDLLHASFKTVKKTAEKYKLTKPEWFKSFRESRSGHVAEHYSPELIKVMNEEVTQYEIAPQNWVTKNTIADRLGTSVDTIERIADKYRANHPSWFDKYKHGKTARILEYYSPELNKAISEEFNSRQMPPSNWETVQYLKKELKVIGEHAIKSILQKYRTTNPEWFKKYKIQSGKFVEHYSPDLIRLVREEISMFEFAPNSWLNNKALSSRLKVSYDTIKQIAEKYRLTNSDWFRMFRTEKRGVIEYYSPELISIITNEVNTRRDRERNEQEAFERSAGLRHKLETFSQHVAQGQTPESQEFRKLLSTFGSAQLVDILYKYHPEFRNIPPDYVKGTLAKYLGDFLIIQNKFNIDDIRPAIQYLSEQPFQESLFEVIKGDCLDHYHREKHKRRTVPNAEIIEEYFASVREKTKGEHSPELEAVIGRAKDYYASLLNEIEKPERIVDTLQEGREFPDLNQVLNMKELEDKKRLLIADEMGLGKSASAILSKEYLGVKCAAVVVPSNVLATWEGYLSDRTSETGEQLGYFKKGQAPKVLVVDSLEKLKTDNPPPSSYDYILISQERMNSVYVTELKKCGIDMLIIDEIHKLKNIAEGKRSQAVIELAKSVEGDGKYLALLSGTPVPNKIQDVAMVLKLLYPERFGAVKDKELVSSIIRGDIVDLRNLLVPRMQIKALRQSVEMPELYEETLTTALTEKELDVYEILLDDDELTADQKIRMFRKYVMNPRTVDPTPDLESSKVRDVGEKLRNVFASHDKVVMFVNSYVEGIMRGEGAIIGKLGLSDTVLVRTIDGTVSVNERLSIQKEFKEASGKILLVVSGQTADVGVDFSPAEHVLIYNEPWTEYDKRQQISREYRPGLKNNLTVTTSIVEGTIEEGISEYILLKYNAIQKLLRGIPLTEIEQDILEKAEKQKAPDVEGDTALAKEWLNSPQNRLHRFFGLTKEIGEKNFHRFLMEHGEEYADCYLDMGGRGFQANTGRVVGTLIKSLSSAKEEKPDAIRILDLASGPEMLKRHIGDEYKGGVVSVDINPLHFKEEGENRLAGSFLALPLQDKSVEYANLSLALHYTRFIQSRKEYERLKVLSEMNRVLKTGGSAVISLIHSLRFKDEGKFKIVAEACGFKIVPQYSGNISSGGNYRSFSMVLEKERDVTPNLGALVEEIGSETLEGLKFREDISSPLRNSRKVIDTFSVHGKELPVSFNSEDAEVFEEEQAIIKDGQDMIRAHGSIREIPKTDIIERGFLRIFNGKSYRLLKKSAKMGGFVDVR